MMQVSRDAVGVTIMSIGTWIVNSESKVSFLSHSHQLIFFVWLSDVSAVHCLTIKGLTPIVGTLFQKTLYDMDLQLSVIRYTVWSRCGKKLN